PGGAVDGGPGVVRVADGTGHAPGSRDAFLLAGGVDADPAHIGHAVAGAVRGADFAGARTVDGGELGPSDLAFQAGGALDGADRPVAHVQAVGAAHDALRL